MTSNVLNDIAICSKNEELPEENIGLSYITELSSDFPIGKVLPEEPESVTRKRPAAIQELLQKKKARLKTTCRSSAHIPSSTILPAKTLQIPSTNPIVSNEPSEMQLTNGEYQSSQQDLLESSLMSDVFRIVCNKQENDDAETTSSSNSQTCTNSSSFWRDNENELHSLPGILNGLQFLDSVATNDLLTQFQKAMFSSRKTTISPKIQEKRKIDDSTDPKLPIKQDPDEEGKSSSHGLVTGSFSDSTGIDLVDLCNGSDSLGHLASVPHSHLFAQVPGRLSLLSNVVKYKMSVGEVRRRLMGPESFNFSLLGALLRRAKMPEKSKMLVEELDSVGLSIPRGRRRLTQISLLSALTESESLQLANDFRKISHSEFPSAELGQLSIERSLLSFSQAEKNATAAASNKLYMLEAALKMANEFLTLLAEDRSPIVDKDPEPIFDASLQGALSNYSMLTHGFGNPAIQVGIEIFTSFLKAQIHAIKQS